MTPASAIHTLPCRDQLRASVIVLHGYSARAAVHLGDGAAFVGAGTEVVLPDAPGHGHREDGRLARIATLPGDARSEAIHDIAREWLTELPSLAAECRERGATRVGVVGISMGGFAALGTLTSPGGIDAVAALLAAPDLVDRASVVAGNPPLLLGLAGKDRSVPPGPGRRFAHECGAELHEYPESEHMMRGDDWHDLWGRTAAFLRRHLGPLPRSWCWDARWLFGCVSPPPPPPLLSDAATDRWPGVEPSLCDPLDAEAIWAAGDFVRYRVESNADGALRTWTVG